MWVQDAGYVGVGGLCFKAQGLGRTWWLALECFHAGSFRFSVQGLGSRVLVKAGTGRGRIFLFFCGALGSF